MLELMAVASMPAFPRGVVDPVERAESPVQRGEHLHRVAARGPRPADRARSRRCAA